MLFTIISAGPLLIIQITIISERQFGVFRWFFSFWKIMKWIIFFCSMNIFRIIAKNVGSNWIFSRNMNFSCVSQIQPKCEHSLLDIIVVVEQKIWTRSHSRQYKINTSDIQNEKKPHFRFVNVKSRVSEFHAQVFPNLYLFLSFHGFIVYHFLISWYNWCPVAWANPSFLKIKTDYKWKTLDLDEL